MDATVRGKWIGRGILVPASQIALNRPSLADWLWTGFTVVVCSGVLLGGLVAMVV